MPETDVLFYCEMDGSTPVLEWLDQLYRDDRRAYNKCVEVINRLRLLGSDLRRPTADFLQDGIYELRARVGRVNYRILYFFHGRNVAVLAHGFTKEREIPKSDLATTVRRKSLFQSNPGRHTHRE